jgi:phasin family protein
MADETKTAADAAADTAKATIEAAGETVKQATKTAVQATKAAEKAAKTNARASKRASKPASTATKKKTRRAKTQRRTSAKTQRRTNARKPEAAAANERINVVNFDPNNWTAGFGAFPAAPFQSLFADAGERGQEAVQRSQQAAEDLTDLTRANVEALVDAGRIAAEGGRSIGQDFVESSREGIEKTAESVRLLAEAKSPTEFVQFQAEFARNSFDRMVSESSRLTESMVKLAGEAFQPLSNRASENAERLNKFIA